MYSFISRIFAVVASLLSAETFATTEPTSESTPSIGQFATQLIEPVSILGNFMGTASLMLGVMCIFAALLRFMQYRVNAYASPLSTVITLIILGIVLLCLPFLRILIEHGTSLPH